MGNLESVLRTIWFREVYAKGRREPVTHYIQFRTFTHIKMMITSYLLSPYFPLLLVVLYYLAPWIRNKSQINIPGPKLAAFSNLWLMYQCRRGKRYAAVDKAHNKYGSLVRLQPNHFSVADPEAINAIYGHGNGFLKSDLNLCNGGNWHPKRKISI